LLRVCGTTYSDFCTNIIIIMAPGKPFRPRPVAARAAAADRTVLHKSDGRCIDRSVVLKLQLSLETLLYRLVVFDGFSSIDRPSATRYIFFTAGCL
jgi:hypothetical protein